MPGFGRKGAYTVGAVGGNDLEESLFSGSAVAISDDSDEVRGAEGNIFDGMLLSAPSKQQRNPAASLPPLPSRGDRGATDSNNDSQAKPTPGAPAAAPSMDQQGFERTSSAVAGGNAPVREGDNATTQQSAQHNWQHGAAAAAGAAQAGQSAMAPQDLVAAAAAAAAAAAGVTVEVVIPPGTPPGSVIQVAAPDGRQMPVQVPAGAQPGMKIRFTLPPPPKMLTVQVQVPEGAKAGQILTVATPSGNITVRVPAGAVAGVTIQFQVPEKAAPPPKQTVQLQLPMGCTPGQVLQVQAGGKVVSVKVPPGAMGGQTIQFTI